MFISSGIRGESGTLAPDGIRAFDNTRRHTKYPLRSGSSTSSKVEPSRANQLQTDTSESKLIRIYATSPLVTVENCKVSRSQLVALNEDFLSIDSMYDMNYSLHNTQTLYHCLYQLTNNSETLDVALQALCLIQLSIRNRDVRLKMESMLMNGKALKMLHRALRDPSTAYATETIAASLCLKTYEVGSLLQTC